MLIPIEVSVVIPVYNNSDSIEELADRLSNTLVDCTTQHEIVFVNDGSTDDSMEILRKVAKRLPAVKVICLSKNYGQHPAICAGFEHARGAAIVLMDADLQDSPEDITSLIDKLRDTEADIVYTVKNFDIKKPTSRITSTIYHRVFSRIVSTKVPENIGTFRIFNRSFLHAVLQFKESNILYGPLMFYMGFKSCFHELPYRLRPHGKSSYTFSKRLQLAVNSLISYTDIPHKASIAFGAVLLLLTATYTVTIVAQYLLFGSSLPGGSTLILLVLCLTLGSVMTSLGIIGSYVFRVYQQVLQRPRYLIQEKINLRDY